MSNLPGFLATHLLLLLGLAVTAEVAGRFLLRGLPAPLGLAPALGFALLADLGFVLGSLWQLSRPGLLLGLAVLLLAAFGPRYGVGVRLIVDLANRAGRLRESLGARRLLVLGLAVLGAGLPPLLLGLYPPTAFDETLYHLPFARAFAATAGLPVLPDLRFPVFPQLAEVLFAEVLLVGPDTAVHLVQALAVLCTAALLWRWGREGCGPWAGALAAAVWLGHPLVVYLGGTAYVEPLLGLFGTAAAYSTWRWWTSGERGWLALAGFCAGSAAGVKYLGLVLVGFLIAFTALAAPAGERSAWRRRLSHLALAGGAALLALLPWYARIVAATGNPVFPFFTSLFGGNAWTSGDGIVSPDGPWAYVRGLLLLPWRALFDRPAVGWMPPASPVWLVALPLLVWGAWRDRQVRFALAPAAAFALAFPFLPQDVRYLVMVLPLACLALGVTLVRLGTGALPRPYARQTAAALALLLVLPGGLYAGYRMARQGPLPVTAVEREAYLTRQLPLYPAVVRLNREMGVQEVAYNLFAERMRDFVHGRYLGDYWGLHPNGRLLAAAGDPAAFHHTLLEWNVDYLLIARQPDGFELPATPAWRARFLPLYADPAAELYRVVPRSGPPPSSVTTGSTAGR